MPSRIPNEPFYLYNRASSVYLSSGAGLILEPKVEWASTTDNRQLWKLVPKESNKFNLQNQRLLVSDPPKYHHLFYDGFDKSIYTVALREDGEEWEVDESSYPEIKLSHPQFKNSKAYLRYDGRSLSISQSDDAYAIWEVSTTPLPSPVNDPKPLAGEYRIRSAYNSKFLLTMHEKNEGNTHITLLKPTNSERLGQTWDVKYDSTTNSYTIETRQTTGAKTFLTTATSEDPDDPLRVVGAEVASAKKWSLEAFNQGLQYRINSIEPNELSIGFSDYEADEDDDVALVKSDRIPSQLWYFEKAAPIGKDQIHAKRVLEAGKYKIRSSLGSTYMSIVVPPMGPEKLARSDFNNATLFTLEYLGTDSENPIFTLSSNEKRIVGNIQDIDKGLAQLQEVVSGEPSKDAQWIVLRHRTDAVVPVFYICHPASAHPVKAISAREPGEGRHNELRSTPFPLEDMVKGLTLHQWEFIKVD